MVRGLVLGVVSLLLALVFAIVAVTKIGSWYWLGYLAIATYGVGAFGCARAARQSFVAGDAVPVPPRRAIGTVLGLAAVVLAVFAARSAVFVTTHTASSAPARSVQLVMALLNGLGAIGSFIAAREYVSNGRAGVRPTVVG